MDHQISVIFSTTIFDIRAKNFYSLQNYVRAILVNTRKRQKWFWGDILHRYGDIASQR